MNKKDIIILGALILLVLMWPMVGPVIERQLFPRPDVEVVEPDEEAPAVARPEETGAATGTAQPPSIHADVPPGAVVAEEFETLEPEQTVLLTNHVVRITLSSRGGTVVGALLRDYRQAVDIESDPVEFDFAGRRTLAYLGLGGLGESKTFELSVSDDARTATLTRSDPSGLELTRLFELDEGYRTRVTDTLRNNTGAAVALPDHAIQIGEMREPGAGKMKAGVYYLGVDALRIGGKGVEYYGKKTMPKAIKNSGKLELEVRFGEPVEWVAVKNRFFAQILTPKLGADDGVWIAKRDDVSQKRISGVAANVALPGTLMEPGGELAREFTLFIGPKKFSELSRYGQHQVDVMDFGMFAPICKFLLWVLNFIHDRLWPHNYGIAIMLLTVIIRILFWPVTHKGTESMRRMQDIQPLMTELREKHKDNPQKQQSEMLALYKEHKVNPLGGCLPMVIQIPVFFALFVVLRSAIELRYAEFLWIRDLSEPENLFQNVLPIGLNILPLVMSVTMVWQQKLTPTTADPRQAKIMQLMPIMMLFIFYGFAAGLVLYWTTSQVLMIVQQVVYKKRRERKEAAAAAG